MNSSSAASAPAPTASGAPVGWWGDIRLFCNILRHRLGEDRISQQAAALAYNTLFSLLPVLVLALVVISMVLSKKDVFHQETLFLHKLGLSQLQNRSASHAHSRLFLRTITGQIEKMRAVLQSPGTGVAGFAVLFWSAMNLMRSMEDAVNRIYRVRRKRPWTRRLTLYWCVLTLGPLGIAASLFVSAKLISLATSLAAHKFILEPASALVGFAGDGLLLFLFYKIIPNTFVRWRSAAIGAIFAAIFWEIGKYGFGLYVRYLAGYGKWYGNLGLIPLFMFWIFLTWSFVLLGLEIAFLHQYRRTLRRRFIHYHGSQNFLVDTRWILPLAVLLVRRFEEGRKLDAQSAAGELGISPEAAEQLLDSLSAAKLAYAWEEDQSVQYVLIRDPRRITADELLRAVADCCHTVAESFHAAPENNPVLRTPLLVELYAQERRWHQSNTLAALAGSREKSGESR
jgi:YihY family inner membrane protein